MNRIAAALVLLITAAAGRASADPKAPAPAAKSDCTLPAAALASKTGASESSGLDLSPSGHPFTHLVVDNPLGNVTVEGYDGTAIHIETRKHAPDDDTLERLRVSLIPSADGTVRITSTADGGREVRPVARGAVRVDLFIRAPRNAHVEAAASAGKLDIANLDAGGDLDTASGPISVCNVSGEVFTHSLTGATRLQQVFGSVDAQAVQADVDLDTITGERLVATVDRGSIAGRRVRSRTVQLTTTDGRIRLEAEVALHGRVSAASLGGDVEVRLHRHGGVIVRAQGAKVDFGALGVPVVLADGWRQIALGAADAAAMVELRSQHGNVQFVIVE